MQRADVRCDSYGLVNTVVPRRMEGRIKRTCSAVNVVGTGEARQVGDEEQVIEQLNRARFLSLTECELASMCGACLMLGLSFLWRALEIFREMGFMRCMTILVLLVLF